jgi:hypothetical protein
MPGIHNPLVSREIFGGHFVQHFDHTFNICTALTARS